MEAATPVRKTTQTRSARKRSLVRAALVVLVIAGLGTWLWSTPAVEYVTVPVDRGDIQSTVTTTGNLNAVTTVQVGSQVSGNIKALYADFNTRVKQGQLIALIDPAPFQAAVDQAAAALSSARAAVLTAEAGLAKSRSDHASARANVASQRAGVVKARSAVNLARVQAARRLVLVREKVTSQEDYDTAKAVHEQALAGVDAAREAENAAVAAADSAAKGVEVAQAQLEQARALAEQARAALAQAQLNLDHTRIVAPVDGTVQSRNMDVGQTVAATFQAPTIFLIAQDLTKMQVDTNVGEADVSAIRVGQVAEFTVDAYPGKVFSAEVRQIRQAPINVQNVITYDVVIAVSNADLKLFPGMTANVTVFARRAANALRVPKTALRYHPRIAIGDKAHPEAAPPLRSGQLEQTVWVLDTGRRLRAVRVATGVSDAGYVEVAPGPLVDGQLLVVGTRGAAASASSPGAAGTPPRRFGF